jgi:SET domain-containing protein
MYFKVLFKYRVYCSILLIYIVFAFHEFRNGQKTPYRKDQTYDFSKHQIFECSPDCSCNSSCTLRATQSGIFCPLVVCSIEGKGLGVMTTVAIPAGTFVCEYVGETVSQKSLEKREDKQQQSLYKVNTQGASFVTYAIEICDKSRDFYVDSS